MRKQSRVVIVSPFSPFPPFWGGAARIFNFAKALSRHLSVTLMYNDQPQVSDPKNSYTFRSQIESDGVRVVPVPRFSRLSQLVNPLLMGKLITELGRSRPVIVISEFPWQGLVALVASRITNTPMILDEHNPEFLRFARMRRGNRISRRVLRWYESFVSHHADRVYCVSEFDKDRIVSEFRIDAARVMVVRNGVDGAVLERPIESRDALRRRLHFDTEQPLFLFHGKLDYAPNVEALKVISAEILPRLNKRLPSARILVAGDNPPDSTVSDPRIINLGVVPDIVEIIKACDATICPLISGGGTRIKIIESAFCGVPVVSTSIGSEGLKVSDFGDGLRIADDWDDFVENMIACIGASRPHGDLVHDALREYDWRNIAQLVAEDVAALERS